nr:hypothetical protein [Bacteroidota bacterium]
MNKWIAYIFPFLFFISTHSLFAQDCGVERWNIKSLSDVDTSKVHFDCLKKSSVHVQVNLPAPFGRLYLRQESETDIYSIDCFIVGFVKADDKDIHVVIEDITTDETMVIEIKSPECSAIQKTSRYSDMFELYNWFLKNIGVPLHSFTSLPQHKLVTITGVGFWDFLHGQKGMANNGREIHPVLSIKFKQN